MGFVLCFGTCISCRRLFYFNPVKVPSFRVNGIKEPICELCMNRVNDYREKHGMEHFKIPYDAYWTCNEEELP